ncbi:MAG: ABC transporter ATP-binding protein [Chlamydiales bacterium]|nr:ABC transporter ATP-binding protein [Chlamydiales bacterium]
MHRLPAVCVENLTFSYDLAPVLDCASFCIRQGEFVGIFGPNGGGKTTLLKILMGLLTPQTGSIHILGRSPKEARSSIGYVPQALQFDKNFPITVLDVVLMGCLSQLKWWGGYPKTAKQAALKALKEVDLEGYAEKLFGTLSGGQAQRALIARAIVARPQILLLDEPTANVDLKAQQEIHKLLAKLNETITILMVTHDLQSIIDKTKRLLCVRRRATMMEAKEVCEHFALGLYHTPLSPSKEHFSW